MWRPEGWKNPYSTLPEHMERDYPVLPEWSAYETGADAMLEGLSHIEDYGGSRYCVGGLISFCQEIEGERVSRVTPKKKGYIVFIPEENE